jgi:tRNA (cmo5U34)-methyltransferase
MENNVSDNTSPHKAAEYDEEVRRTVPFYHLFHTETIDLVRTLLPDVSVWLDTGCGTGYLAEHALPLLPGVRFLLADPSQAMLDQARGRLARFPSARVCFLGAVATEELAGVVSETPQVISAIQCHHYGGEEVRRLATAVCYRLLEPGDLYVTFENIRPDTARGVDIALERWLRFQREAGRTPQAVEEHRSRFGRNYFPITVAEHLRLLRETGFTVVETFWLSQMQAGFYAIK